MEGKIFSSVKDSNIFCTRSETFNAEAPPLRATPYSWHFAFIVSRVILKKLELTVLCLICDLEQLGIFDSQG